jgi:hypothetical protein
MSRLFIGVWRLRLATSAYDGVPALGVTFFRFPMVGGGPSSDSPTGSVW